MRPTVAVTGATGFIGPHIVERLRADGWQLRLLTRRPTLPPSLHAPEIEIVQGTLEDHDSRERLLDSVDAVVHVAGLIRARSRAGFFEGNAKSVERLAGIARAAGTPPRFILMSSLAARVPEISDYAASKREGEARLIAAGDRVPWTILRPPAVYGPGDRATLPFFRCIARGLGLMTGSDDARISLIHVRDLAAAVGAVLTSDRAHGLVTEVDDGHGGYSWRDMIGTAAKVFGRTPRIARIPKAIPYGLGEINLLLARLPGYTPMLTPGKVRELYHRNWVCDSEPLMSHTCWRPELPLADGFADTISWYRQQGWL
ncbi:MAG: NAD-dependent epimerase/dehydratase family protein [Pseudomonadota bacterium]